MSLITESLGTQSPINATLKAGLDTISQNKTVTFYEYTRKILPLDGFVFWLRTEAPLIVKGSLHIATTLAQREDETQGTNRAVFTCEQPVQDFSVVDPETIWVAALDDIGFAFSAQANFYEQAGIYHYSGEAINPAMMSQMVDNVLDLDLTNVVVSNSLPVWLALSSSLVFGKTAPTFPVYPSFLVPQNVLPPYASVHIGDGDTDALQSAPSFDSTSSHFQLCRDRVRITFYGVRNDEALAFQDYLFQYSLDTDIIGIMNMPVIRDEKRTQRELGIIAQKKSLTVDVSYYQSRIVDIARQFILDSVVEYLPTLTP